MIYNCILKENNDSDILISINDVDLLCFSNQGIIGKEGGRITLELNIFDDIEIECSKSNVKNIEYMGGYEYKITGLLDVDKRGVDSLIFFELDDLYDYSFLDKKMVDLYVLRIDVSNVD